MSIFNQEVSVFPNPRNAASRWFIATVASIFISEILIYLAKMILGSSQQAVGLEGLALGIFFLPIIFIILPVYVIYTLIFLVRKWRAQKNGAEKEIYAFHSGSLISFLIALIACALFFYLIILR